MPDANPVIIKWARESTGLTLAAAAKSLGLADTKKLAAHERLASIESGDAAPSRTLLREMARVYRRPVLVFFLDAPPRKGDRGKDFRKAPGASDTELDPQLDALIRSVKSRQAIIRSVLEDEESDTVEYVGAATLRTPPEVLVRRISSAIDFALADYRSQPSLDSAFAYLRSRIESAGVFVVLAGDLGSHHSRIPVSSFRGFALSDALAPLIVINDQDARVAWPFTALHELIHIWLGDTGVSGQWANNDVERFCNAVAGRILLAADELDELGDAIDGTTAGLQSAISAFASTRHISRAMVAYRLFLDHRISQAQWQGMVQQYQDEWVAKKESERQKRKPDAGGPSYYVVRRHRLGNALLHLVKRALGSGLITPTKAGLVLGVKPRNVESLLRDAHNLGGG